MISSSNNPSDEQWLDAMLIVYSLLEAHPASTTCEQFAHSHRRLVYNIAPSTAAVWGREGGQSTLCFCMLCGPDTFSLFVSDADARIIIALWLTL
jgi:hypothetical protein